MSATAASMRGYSGSSLKVSTVGGGAPRTVALDAPSDVTAGTKCVQHRELRWAYSTRDKVVGLIADQIKDPGPRHCVMRSDGTRRIPIGCCR